MGQEFDDVPRGMRVDAGEHVGDVVDRIDAVLFA
jgi:hypothetical protein